MKQSKYVYHNVPSNRDYQPVRYNRHEVRNRPSWLFLFLLFVAIVVALAFVFPNVLKGLAYGDRPLKYNHYGCIPYTHAMISTGYASGLTHSPCSDGQDTPRKNKRGDNEAGNETPIVTSQDTAPLIVVTPPQANPPTVDSPPSNDAPKPDKQKCNAGSGNGSEGNPDCDPGNSGEHNNGGD